MYPELLIMGHNLCTELWHASYAVQAELNCTYSIIPPSPPLSAVFFGPRNCVPMGYWTSLPPPKKTPNWNQSWGLCESRESANVILSFF